MSIFCWGKSFVKFYTDSNVFFYFSFLIQNILRYKFQQELHYDAIANVDVDLLDSNFAGEYMINIMVHFKGVGEYLCTNLFGEFYRI